MKKLALLGIVCVTPAVVLGAIALAGARRLTRRRKPAAPADPADYGLCYEEVVFLSQDGITLRGWFMPAARPRGTIIFCPGQAGSMDPDLCYAPAVIAADFSVLMFDYRGHGRSGGDLVTMGYDERLDVLAAIRYLKHRSIDRVGLLGFSMGGAVAMTTASLSPAVIAIVSDGGFARLETTAGWYRGWRLPHGLAAFLGRLTVWATGRYTGRDLPQADPIGWVDQIAPRALLLIYGEQDPYIPMSDARALFERAGEPKELWLVPAAGHREADHIAPQEYMTRILGFFERSFPAP